jgi:hypothetical protein
MCLNYTLPSEFVKPPSTTLRVNHLFNTNNNQKMAYLRHFRIFTKTLLNTLISSTLFLIEKLSSQAEQTHLYLLFA